MSASTVLLAIIVGVAGYLIAIYNKFVSLQAGIDAAWSDIDVQLKRRYNLIPALVDVVKGYKDYEAGTLEKIIHAVIVFAERIPAEMAENPSSAIDGFFGADVDHGRPGPFSQFTKTARQGNRRGCCSTDAVHQHAARECQQAADQQKDDEKVA